MKEVFDAVNQVFDFVVPIADFLWGSQPILIGMHPFPFWGICPLPLSSSLALVSFSASRQDLSR